MAAPPGGPPTEAAAERPPLVYPAALADRGRVVQPTSVPKRIKGISFGTFGPADVQRLSHVQLTRSDHDDGPDPVQHGVLDARMGVCQRLSLCQTCGLGVDDCQGHFGHICLPLPVFHNGFLKHILHILRCICKGCSRVLLPKDQRKPRLRVMRNPATGTARRQRLFQAVVADCQKVVRCPHCGFVNGKVKREAGWQCPRLVHERYGDGKTVQRDKHQERLRLDDDLEHAAAANDDALMPFLQGKRLVDELNPVVCCELLDRIPLEDRELLDLDRDVSPANLMCSTLLVPPVVMRPRVNRGLSGGPAAGQMSDDDLTRALRGIIAQSLEISAYINDGEVPSKVWHMWEVLQQRCASYLDADLPGYPKTALDGRHRRHLVQRLKGTKREGPKEGRFRKNLSGKRVDFSGRTVISPDPNLRVTEVAIPEKVARTLTYPERVFKHNRARLAKAVVNGAHEYPGACYVKPRDGVKRGLAFIPDAERRRIADALAPGDVVERHMINGDCVIFNRQPSLHRQSMMCHRARVLPYRTFRFNECCCAPYNADFDGDEMNIHLPQTEEARAECAVLMGTARNIISVRHGEPIIAATQDFLTGAYLISHKGTFLRRAEASQVLAHMHEDGVVFQLPPPAILKPVELWTGKQIMSLLVRPNPRVPVALTFEAPAKAYTRPRSKDPFDCLKDGWVMFQESEMISGTLDKAVLGGGSKHGLFYNLFLAAGHAYSARAMWRLSRLTSRWLSHHGFSIGISDVTPSTALCASKDRLVQDGNSACSTLLARWAAGKLEAEPGYTVGDTLEIKMNQRLAAVRTECGTRCMSELHHRNAAVIMSICGSKGNAVNISQMAATLGQVTVSGRRIANGFIQRALPHFERRSKLPPARGFVPSSFFSGLAPHEFWFHTMGGREGLVDTAVKTADTGYMQRRLMKSMEDLCVQYDNKVTDSEGTVVQLRYGDDGVDPLYTETQDFRPVNLSIVWSQQQKDNRALRRKVGVPTAKQAADAEQRLAAAGFPVTVADAGYRGAEVSAAARAHFEAGEKELSMRLRWDLAILLAVPLQAGEVLPYLESRLAQDPRFRACCGTEGREAGAFSGRFIDELRDFFRGKAQEFSELVESLARTREGSKQQQQQQQGPGAFPSLSAWYAARQAKRRESWSAFSAACEVLSITRSAVDCMLEKCYVKHQEKTCEPGTTCGTLAAQSICEPATQMTLRTFHQAGLSMSITQGVPRIKEIINASRTIKTPIIHGYLVNETDEKVARVVKARVEKTRLGDIISYVEERYTPQSVYLAVRIDLAIVERRSLDHVTVHTVRSSILAHAASQNRKRQKLPLTASHVVAHSEDTLYIYPYDSGAKDKLLHTLHNIKIFLPEIVIAGIDVVERAVIKRYKEEGGVAHHMLLIESEDLLRVLAIPGIDATRTTSNHIYTVERTFGIEAARALIISEIRGVMRDYEARIDIRHIMHLADVMTFRGVVLGITRHGMAKMWDSVLMLASFERTADVLFDAAVHRRSDKQMGVSQQIIFGAPIKAGTGLFHLLRKVDTDAPSARAARRPLFLGGAGGMRVPL
eukprot:TRINITY_DN3635_c0_g1_i1.p1 TRINITY_DN3635_c0_g1~~TRINITY_DN3635_c0_g1_i1.p1  ORF type:complete len:1556 (+),score=500.11 TRINITY_DN3635_c0_g1_i1:86-4753(+)